MDDTISSDVLLHVARKRHSSESLTIGKLSSLQL
jgi:hypothetical protein